VTDEFTFTIKLTGAQMRLLRRFRNVFHTMFKGSTFNMLAEADATALLDNIIAQTEGQAPPQPSHFAGRSKPRQHDPHPPNCGCMYCMNG
jgi:hypothetical protein